MEEKNEQVKVFYEAYAQKLLAYTRKNYGIAEDDAWTLVYQTIYRMAEVSDRYTFENRHKQNAFVFKMHINFLRNYFRDNKSFEAKHAEVDMREDLSDSMEEAPESTSLALRTLQNELDKLEDWQRILLLMRGQGIPYSEIAVFVSKPEKQLKVYYARLKMQLLENINAHLTSLKLQAHEK
jgi:DNA-directed RNA polymerase specialized sigma24 family protein